MVCYTYLHAMFNWTLNLSKRQSTSTAPFIVTDAKKNQQLSFFLHLLQQAGVAVEQWNNSFHFVSLDDFRAWCSLMWPAPFPSSAYFLVEDNNKLSQEKNVIVIILGLLGAHLYRLEETFSWLKTTPYYFCVCVFLKECLLQGPSGLLFSAVAHCTSQQPLNNFPFQRRQELLLFVIELDLKGFSALV